MGTGLEGGPPSRSRRRTRPSPSRPLTALFALAHARWPRPPAEPAPPSPPGAPLGFILLLCPQSTSSSPRRCPAWRKSGPCIRWLSVRWPSPAPPPRPGRPGPRPHAPWGAAFAPSLSHGPFGHLCTGHFHTATPTSAIESELPPLSSAHPIPFRLPSTLSHDGCPAHHPRRFP